MEQRLDLIHRLEAKYGTGNGSDRACSGGEKRKVS